MAFGMKRGFHILHIDFWVARRWNLHGWASGMGRNDIRLYTR